MRAIKVLIHAEYWTPAECAEVLGRSDQYWRDAYRAGHVSGYDTGAPKRPRVWIQAKSARAYLAEKLPEYQIGQRSLTDLQLENREKAKALRAEPITVQK